MKADAAGTLKAISNMGYKYVEHASYVDVNSMAGLHRIKGIG
jgi:hypothetical protein